MEILQACCRRGRFVFVFDNTWSFTISSHFRVMVECLCCFYSALSHDRRVFNKFKIRWFWLALLVSVYLNLLHRAMFGSNQHRSRYPFSYRFPKDITSVFSLVFSIIMCILSLWVSSLFEGNRELSCVSGTREEARDPRISSPLACSLACYRAPRLACHSKWRACSQDFVFLAFFAVHFQWHSWAECVTCWWLLFFLRL